MAQIAEQLKKLNAEADESKSELTHLYEEEKDEKDTDKAHRLAQRIERAEVSIDNLNKRRESLEQRLGKRKRGTDETVTTSRQNDELLLRPIRRSKLDHGVTLSGVFIQHDKELEHLWEALSNTVEIDNFVELPRAITSLFNVAPEFLFQREDYTPLKTFFRSLANEKTDRKMVLLGTAGTGKSTWLLSLLRDLCIEGKSVLFQGHKTGSPKFLSRDVCGTITEDNLKKLGDNNPQFWHLVDSEEPTICQAPTALASTPEKAKVGEFSKDAAEKFLPDFTTSEMWLLHTKCFAHVPVQLVQNLLEKWGGIPRMVLRRAIKYWQADLDKLQVAINSCSKDTLLSACRNEDTQQASERVLRFIPKADYSRGHRVFGTPFIANGVYKKLSDDQADSISAFLYETKEESACKSLHGYFYEKRVLDRFQSVKMAYDNIDPDNTGIQQPDIVLGKWERRSFESLNQIEKARKRKNVLWAPKPGFKALDCLSFPYAMQITVSESHSALSTTSILASFKALRAKSGDSSQDMLLYIVPPHLKNRVKHIPLEGRGRREFQKRIVFIPYNKP